MVKSTQHFSATMIGGSSYTDISIASIDVSKTNIILQGSSFILHDVSGVITPVSVFPYVVSLTETNLRIAMGVISIGLEDFETADVSVTVAEYI